MTITCGIHCPIKHSPICVIRHLVIIGSQLYRTSLFEDLSGGVLVLLAVVNDRLVPCPHGLDKSLVLFLGGVQLSELVALVVGSYVKDGDVVIATDDKGTLDDRVVVLAVYGGAAEQVLTRTLKTGVETANKVVGHESQGQLIVVLVLASPDRVVLEGDILEEPLDGDILIVVRVVALPLVKSKLGSR